jgi:hypothetical protein
MFEHGTINIGLKSKSVTAIINVDTSVSLISNRLPTTVFPPPFNIQESI